jgi:cyclophilin family peptidyl-prolyl cis-trans isomerase
MGNDAQADPALRIGFQAIDPRVAWNSANNQFLVVWQGEDDTAPLVDNEFEVFGRIVTHTGVTTGTQQRLSVMGPDGDVNYRAAAPDLAYNPDDNEFLVVWYGDDNTGGPIDDENEVFARRVNAQSGALAGGQFRVSEAGGTGNTSFGAFNPAVAYNQAGGSYFIVWRADMAVDNKWDIYGRRVSGAGSALDPTDVRISSMGPEEDTLFGGFNATIALNSADQQYLIAWNGDDDTPPLVDGETEVFGQLIADVALIDYQTRGADDGPAHRITTGLRIGALIDSETDGRPSFAADGDDLLETDDEDGPTTTPVRIVTGPAPNPLIAVSVTNTLGVSATLYGWVDYNGDGVFDNATERGSAAVPSAGGPLSAPPLLLPAVPDNATTLTFLRLRLSTDPAAANPTGLADDGEVEDYVVEIVPPPAPEIAIRGNGIEIADGDTSPTVADHRDFGTADALTTVVVHTLLIDNGAGAADLALLTSPPVQLSGVGTDQFVVLTQPAQNPVPAGASTPLDIMFRPTRLGTHTATVVIQSNDSDESVYTFSVIGRSFQYGAGNGLGLVLNYLLGITSDPTGLDYNNDGAVDIGDAVDRVNN